MLESVAPVQERVFVYEAFELSGFPLLALLRRFLCVFSLLVWLWDLRAKTDTNCVDFHVAARFCPIINSNIVFWKVNIGFDGSLWLVDVANV